MSDAAQTIRQLKLKTGVVKRLFKEEKSYRQETEQAEARLQKLRDDGADGADIRNAERVVKDSQQMIPRTQTSLDEAVATLEDLVGALSSEEEISASQEYKDASEQLQALDRLIRPTSAVQPSQSGPHTANRSLTCSLNAIIIEEHAS